MELNFSSKRKRNETEVTGGPLKVLKQNNSLVQLSKSYKCFSDIAQKPQDSINSSIKLAGLISVNDIQEKSIFREIVLGFVHPNKDQFKSRENDPFLAIAALEVLKRMEVAEIDALILGEDEH